MDPSQQPSDLFDAIVVQPITTFVTQLWTFFPRLLGALALFCFGFAVAKALEGVCVKVLKIAGVNKLAERTQISEMLAKGGIRTKLAELIGAIVYWLFMLLVVMITFNALELTIAAELFQDLVGFLPKVISAIFILILGIFAAVFLSATVRTASANAGITQSELLGQLVQTIVIVFSAVTALQQLEIQFVGEVFLIILAGISLAAGLSFGLGCRDIAGKWVANLIEQINNTRRR